MYVGELHVGAIMLHAKWGFGRVVRREETYVLGKFQGGKRHKLAYNDRAAVWATPQTAEAGQPLPVAA